MVNGKYEDVWDKTKLIVLKLGLWDVNIVSYISCSVPSM